MSKGERTGVLYQRHERYRVLLAHEDVSYARHLGEALEKRSPVRFQCIYTFTLEDTSAALRKTDFDAILLHLELNSSSDLSTFKKVYEAAPSTPIIVLTQLDNPELAEDLMERGAQDYLVESNINPDAIARVIRYSVHRKHAEEKLRESQEQLFHAQKMEGMGRLAGGVAHDFNNLITSMLGFASFAKNSIETDHPSQNDLKEIVIAGERAAALTRQLLAFSRKDVVQIQPTHLNDIVQGMDHLLRRTLGEDIQLDTELGELPRPILADIGQLEQVIINLAVNARDAMPMGGKLSISTKVQKVLAERESATGVLYPGIYAVFRMKDSGIGMSSEVANMIFEPFYTTKGKEHGTGLGLSTVFGIIHSIKGQITLDTAPHKGSEFNLFIPLATSLKAKSRKSYTAASPTGTETVLLVEDEDMLRRLAGRILSGLGYNVIEAPDGSAALKVGRAYEGTIDLVLTDVVMPNLCGPEFILELSRYRTDFKYLYMSGFTDERIQHHGLDADSIRLVKKPYTQEILARNVRDVLDGVA